MIYEKGEKQQIIDQTPQPQYEEEEKYNKEQKREEIQSKNKNDNLKCGNRSWHKNLDCLINPLEVKKGKFSEEEVEHIMQIVNKYLEQNNLNSQDLKDYIELKSQCKLSNLWLHIAKQIPNRTVDSIYKLIRRKFDSKNRNGYWSKQEEADLIKYIQKHGRNWREISQYFNRTPDNIRAKYANLGEYNHLFRIKGQWTIGEFLQFILKIQNLTQQTILLQNYDQILLKKFGQQFNETQFCLNFRKMNQFDRETFIFLKSIIQIPKQFKQTIKWTEISQEIKTKTNDDLRQLWFKLDSQ